MLATALPADRVRGLADPSRERWLMANVTTVIRTVLVVALGLWRINLYRLRP